MNLQSYLILALVLLGLVAALFAVRRGKSRGCCGTCAGCKGCANPPKQK